MSGQVVPTDQQLRLFIERIERLEEEKTCLRHQLVGEGIIGVIGGRRFAAVRRHRTCRCGEARLPHAGLPILLQRLENLRAKAQFSQ